MDTLGFISQIVQSFAWPIVVVVIAFLFKRPLSQLVLIAEKIKYKDLEIVFKKELAVAKSTTSGRELPDLTDRDRVMVEQETRQSPTQAILTAWRDIEETIYRKLKELLPLESPQSKRLTPARAYNELWLTGVMTPLMEDVIQRLHFLRNQLAHRSDYQVSSETVWEYVLLAKRIQKKIEALTELPAAQLSPLTYMVLQINSLIDSGKYSDITLDDIEREIERGSLFQYLIGRAKGDVDFSIILKGTTYPRFEKFYIDRLQNICNAYSGNERRKWGVQNLGLCLLLAWTNEIIQQGGGWHPNE